MSQKIPKVPCHKQKIILRSRGCPGFPVAGEWAFDRSLMHSSTLRITLGRSLSHSPIYPKFGKPVIDQRSPVSSLRHTGGRRAIDRTLTRTQNSGRPTTIVIIQFCLRTMIYQERGFFVRVPAQREYWYIELILNLFIYNYIYYIIKYKTSYIINYIITHIINNIINVLSYIISYIILFKMIQL